MSVVRFITIFCDGLPDNGCEAVAEYGLTSSKETHRMAHEAGWVSVRNWDYCPEHTDAAVQRRET